MPGYSGTPLIKKLGIKPHMLFHVSNAPSEYQQWLGDLPNGSEIVPDIKGDKLAALHLFHTDSLELQQQLESLRNRILQDAFIWVSWPKKSSKVPTSITEDVIRDIALPMGYVDIKVCAVSEVWSGLKLVIRKSERNGSSHV